MVHMIFVRRLHMAPVLLTVSRVMYPPANSGTSEVLEIMMILYIYILCSACFVEYNIL